MLVHGRVIGEGLRVRVVRGRHRVVVSTGSAVSAMSRVRRGSVTAATMLLVSVVMARGGSRQGRATKILRMLMTMVMMRMLHGRVRRRGRGAVAAAAGTVVGVGQGWLGTTRRGVAGSKGGER